MEPEHEATGDEAGTHQATEGGNSHAKPEASGSWQLLNGGAAKTRTVGARQELSELASRIASALEAQSWSSPSEVVERVQEDISNKPVAMRTPVLVKAVDAQLSEGAGGLFVCKTVPGREPLYAARHRMTCEQCGGRCSEPLVCDDAECRTAWHPGCLPELLKQPPAGPWRCPCCTEFGRPITEDLPQPAQPPPPPSAAAPGSSKVLEGVQQVLRARPYEAAWMSFAALADAVTAAGVQFRKGSGTAHSSVRRAVSLHISCCQRRGIPPTLVLRQGDEGETEVALALPDPPCERCRTTADPDETLLCDACNKAWHMYCLPKKLKAIPEGEWLCPNCDEAKAGKGVRPDLQGVENQQPASVFFTLQEFIGKEESPYELFYVCSGEAPDPYSGMRLAVVGKKVCQWGNYRYWSPASVEGPRLGVATTRREVRRWLDQSIGACEKIKAPPVGVPTSLLPSEDDIFLPHKYSTQKLPQALHGLLPDDDSAPSPPFSSPHPPATEGKHVTWGGGTRGTRKRGLSSSSTPGDDPRASPHEPHRKTPRLLSIFGGTRVHEAAAGSAAASMLAPLLAPANPVAAQLRRGLSVHKAVPKKEGPRHRFCEECRGRGSASSELLVCSDPECTTAWHLGCLPELLEKPPADSWRCPCCVEFGRPIAEALPHPVQPLPPSTTPASAAAATPGSSKVLEGVQQVLRAQPYEAAWMSLSALTDAVAAAGVQFRKGSGTAQSSVRRAVSLHISCCQRRGEAPKLVLREGEGGGETEVTLALPDPPCERCRTTADPDETLLCDACNKAWHMYCLPKKLKAIPEGEWLCPNCTSGAETKAGKASRSKHKSTEKLKGGRKRRGTTAFFMWQEFIGKEKSPYELFYVCSGEGPNPFSSMRLAVVGKKINQFSNHRYWSPASVEGPRLGVVTNRKEVRRFLDESLGAGQKIKAPPEGVPAALLPTKADVFLPHEFLPQKMLPALHGMLPDKLIGESAECSSRPTPPPPSASPTSRIGLRNGCVVMSSSGHPKTTPGRRRHNTY